MWAVKGMIFKNNIKHFLVKRYFLFLLGNRCRHFQHPLFQFV